MQSQELLKREVGGQSQNERLEKAAVIREREDTREWIGWKRLAVGLEDG